MNIVDNIHEDIELLQDNFLMMQEMWELGEPDLKNGSRLKYPFKLCKKFVRKIIRWFLRPYYEQQIAFNGALVRAVGDIYRIQNNLLLLKGQDLNIEAYYEKDVLLESEKPRIIQIVATLNYGDAVGNDVIAIKNTLKEKGIVTEIYATSIHKKIPEGTVRPIRRLPELRENDMVIYHFAAEDPLIEVVKTLKCKKILRYHNVTPPEFFKNYDKEAEKNTRNGLKQIREIKDDIDYVMTVSDFNAQNLKDMGYNCPIYVVPILIRFEDYEQEPSKKIIEKYSDGVKNIVFVGRIAPNKKIEDLISAYDYYHKKIDSNTRLIIVGSCNEKSKYFDFLKRHIKRLMADNVIFTGHIAFEEILGYYRTASIFLCMSEHEGFCVPLVESMYFNIPIVAYASTAIPKTLNGCGVLLESKNPPEVAEGLKLAFEKRTQLIKDQEKRLEDFDNSLVAEQMLTVLENIAKEKII